MKQHQIEVIKEQIVIHKNRLSDPELTDHEKTGILKLIDDHEKQVAKGADEEFSSIEILKKQIAIHTKRLAEPELTELQGSGIKKLITDLKNSLSTVKSSSTE